MIQNTQIEVHLLNSSELLNYLESLSFADSVSKDSLEHELFQSFHKLNRYQPDHILTAKLKEIDEYAAASGLSVGPMLALKRLAGQYFEEHSDCCVRLDLFGYWQNLISRISPVPIQAFFYAYKSRFANSDPKYRWPVYPFHPAVEDYISRNQLHESHQHLNGSSNAETCWLDALNEPELTTAKFGKEFRDNPKLRQLCEQISYGLNPEVLLARLNLAKHIRLLLANMVCSRAQNCERLNLDFLHTSYPIALASVAPKNLLECIEASQDICVPWPTQRPYSDDAEFNLLFELISSLLKYPNQDPLVERLLWLYLLIQNQYLTLLVQRDDFYGFDQFQKYTYTELRDFTESDYLKRFKQAHGYGYKSQTGFLEGRFAPKSDIKSFEKLLTSIFRGYVTYLYPEIETENLTLSHLLEKLDDLPPSNKAKLALVVHFIKRRHKKDDAFPYKTLYQSLTRQADLLIHLLKINPLLTQWVRGIDAAANEMDTPPEVFAPLFRVLKAQGIRHATYHVGEDFAHLISGIRAIDDAVRFLPLANGDRLGHCTAIGITPALWRRSIPPTLSLTKENRLLDLIFVWRTLRHNQGMLNWAHLASSEALNLAQAIFKDPSIQSIEQLNELYELRDVYPLYQTLEGEEYWQTRAASCWDHEYQRIDKLICRQEKHSLLGLYRRWLFDEEVRVQRYSVLSFPTNWLPDSALIVLQQAVMIEIVKRNIAVECPPTSNTRVSQYVEVKEHHVFRWMGIPGYAIENDVKMSVCLASDDPGIFVTDLKAEFYHLFAVLTNQMKLPVNEALLHVSQLNENGRIFRFHAPNLV